MKVLNQLHNPTIVSQLSRIYPVQSLAPTGFYGVYNYYPPSTIIRNPNQIFSNSFAQYNPSPSINYSHLPITNLIPIHHYSCQSLPINYSVPNLSYPGCYNSVSSIGYSSLPTRITYYSTTYQSLNPPIPPNFYAPQSSNLSHNIVSSNLSNFNVSSYRSNQVALNSKPPIEFTDNFSMRIKKADDSCDNFNLKQIASLVPNGFTAGILEPEIDPRNNKLKICNSVSLKEIPSKIWIRNGDNLVEVPNHLLEKNPQIYNQNLDSLPMITSQTIISETSFSHKDIVHDSSFNHLLFPKIMMAFNKLSNSLIRINKITNLEEEILGTNFFGKDLSTSTKDKELTSISDSTSPPSTLSLSPTPPSSTINRQLEITTLKEKMDNGDLDGYRIGSEFIIKFTENQI